MLFIFRYVVWFSVAVKSSVFALKQSDVIGDQWFVQKLDHFDLSSSRTWWQKYHTNETWFRNSRNSPVFLLIGGNSRAESASVAEGAFMNYVSNHSALALQLEHRYYGESRPTEDFSVNNLRFLTIDQALADVASFVNYVNSRYKLTPNNKWVVFGKGYAGSLAAWARLKYPHLIHAAVASSAPLQAEAGYAGFDHNAWNTLSSIKASCPANIHKAALAMENLLSTPNGVQILTKKFKLCRQLNPKNDTEVSFFVESLATNVRNAVETQVNSLIASNPTYHRTIDEICTLMSDTKFGNEIDRYSAVHSLYTFGSLFTFSKCTNITYDEFLKEYKEESVYSAARPWLFQRCSELGFFPISSSETNLFGSLVDLKFYINTCSAVFGVGFDAKRMEDGVGRTNIMYGGLDLDTSRTIFLGGSLDLWRDLGLQKSPKPEMPVVVIEGAGHGADMNVPSLNDAAELVKARKLVQKTIGQWLSGSSKVD